MSEKPLLNILFVCWALPHARVRHSGGMDFYHYIQSLVSRGHSVSIISFITRREEEAVSSMQKLCHEVVPVSYRDTLLHKLLRVRWRLIFPKVYGNARSSRFRVKLWRLTRRERFDIAHIDGRMAQYRGLVHRAKTVLDEVDVFSLTAYYNYWNERRWWWRWYDLLEWLRLQALEIHYAHAYDAVLTRSEKDKYFLKSYLPHQRIEVLSPWFEGLDELGDIPITRPPGNTLLFMGTMNLEPNVEAVLYFCQKVLPLVRARVPDATLYIIGSSPAPVIQRLGFEKGIVVTGEVESLRPFYEMCVVNVVPLLTGGGIIVKTLNGMAAGRPTVATSLGSAGVEAVPGREIIIADTPERMAHAIVELLTCENLWYSLAHGGRRFVQAKYNWEKAMDNLENLYSSLLTAEDKNRFAC